MTTQTKTTWRKVKLGEVANVLNGYAFSSRAFIPKSGEAIPVFKMGNIKKGGGIQWTGKEDYIPENQARGLVRFLTEPEDILMCMTDMKANVRLLGYSAFIKNEKFLVNQRVGRIKAKKNLAQARFLFYYLNSPNYISFIRSTARSGVQVNLTTEEIRKSPLLIPDITDQKRIADILSVFDDKIELNNKISAALEQMAQAIFKEWFIENSKFKVKSEKLEAVCDIVYGKDLPIKDLKKSGFPVYGGNGIIGYSGKHLFSKPQIIVGCRGAYSGNIFKTEPKSFVTHNSLILKIKEKQNIGINYLFYALQKSNVKSSITGSAQPQITIAELNQVSIPISDENLMREFENMASVIENYKFKVINENQKLAALRDLLLPKLMSGEIRV